jgi:hypothetical protein
MASIALRVLSRALRRPVRVLVIALLATGALVGARALKAPSYEATLYFRLAEGDLTDPNNSPQPPHAIREHLTGVVLSRTRVEEIMRKYQWSPGRLARDRMAAVDEFRDAVEIDVSRNYFLYDRSPGDPPRSAQVTISVSGRDAEKTRSVAHEIGQAILAEQRGQRSVHLAQASGLLRARLELANARIKSLRETIDRLWLETARAGAHESVGLRAQVATLEVQRKFAIKQAVALERRAAAVSFTAAAENEKLGLNFELLDERLVTQAPHLTPFQLTGRAALTLTIALILSAAVIGAFDDRIYGLEDLVARGLPLFGAVPRFPGDEVGSYRARTSPERVPS